jgi:endonuclease/exonuclease/phosphatase family metal-dependent hydrolase
MNCLGLPVPMPGLRRRLGALGRTLAAASADFACLQEVGRWRHLPLLRHDEDRWPHAIALPYPYAPKGGLVTLARMPVATTSFHAFRERGRTASLHATERYQGKGVLAVSLTVEDQPVMVLNTHLSANYRARWSYSDPYAKVERAQLHEITEVLHTIPAETLVLVAGDFNVPRGSWLYDEFMGLNDLHDPLGASTEPTYRPMPGMPARAAQALDHILVRAPTGLVVDAEAELCFRDQVWLAHGALGYLSDHLGVRLTLRWEAQLQAGTAEAGPDEPRRVTLQR